MRQYQCKIVCFLIFLHMDFYENDYDIIWCCFLPVFLTGFQEFLHKHLLYKSLKIFTGFFEDTIHSMWYSSAQEGVLQNIFVITCPDQQLGLADNRRHGAPPSATLLPNRCACSPSRPSGWPPCMYKSKRMNGWMRVLAVSTLSLKFSHNNEN
jgi:hypothetical protein